MFILTFWISFHNRNIMALLKEVHCLLILPGSPRCFHNRNIMALLKEPTVFNFRSKETRFHNRNIMALLKVYWNQARTPMQTNVSIIEILWLYWRIDKILSKSSPNNCFHNRNIMALLKDIRNTGQWEWRQPFP